MGKSLESQRAEIFIGSVRRIGSISLIYFSFFLDSLNEGAIS